MQHLAPPAWLPLLIDKVECLRWVVEQEDDALLAPSDPSKDHPCVTTLLARQLIRRTESLEWRLSREPLEAQFREASEKDNLADIKHNYKLIAELINEFPVYPVSFQTQNII